jgi:PAS domain S-box-containing protein
MKADSQTRESIVIAVLIAATLAVFAVDVSVELGIAGAVPYIVVIWLAFLSRLPWTVWATALFCSILTIIGFVISPDDGETWKVVANRSIALCAVWLTAAMASRLRSQTVARPSVHSDQSIWSRLLNQALARTVLLLIGFFALSVAVVVWQQIRLQDRLIRSAAESEARRYSAALSVFRTLYTEHVVETVRKHDIEVTHDFDSEGKRGKAIPLPATLSMRIGNELTHAGSGGGTRLYSKYPFPYPDRTGLDDSFAQEAWAALTDDPGTPLVRFGERAGVRSLRYATADRMRAACVDCHNTHPDSPKTDWQEGDVRGVLEVTIPLDMATVQARSHLQESLAIFGALGVAGVVLLALLIGRLQHSAQVQTRLAAIVESSDDAIIGKTLDGIVTSWNRGAEQLYGYSANEMIGEAITRLVPPNRPNEVAEILDRLRNDDSIEHFETVGLHKNGRQLEVALTISPIQDDGGNVVGVSTIGRDITERKRLEEARQKLNEELERRVEARTHELAKVNDNLQQSNADLEQFAYVASHDLQEPLRAIVGYSQLLKKQLGDTDGDKGRFLDNIVEGGQRMQTLIGDLLDYSRVNRQGTPLKPVEVQSAISEAIANLKAAIIEAGADVTCGSMPTILADRRQITQLFQNMIGNGIKYRADRTPQIDIQYTQDEDSWTFSVTDNGIGIEPEFHSQIFVIFKRLHTRRQYSGTGIGLALCQQIVKRHGGRIQIESTPGSSTTFHIKIPKVPPASEGQSDD